ncbi:MAG: hypothetical protein EOO24_00895 [Comamonadaceae bacterium]|nr:MAG: hypothetical protein EOO24_00895 [Comamonadaceae bacterium]
MGVRGGAEPTAGDAEDCIESSGGTGAGSCTEPVAGGAGSRAEPGAAGAGSRIEPGAGDMGGCADSAAGERCVFLISVESSSRAAAPLTRGSDDGDATELSASSRADGTGSLRQSKVAMPATTTVAKAARQGVRTCPSSGFDAIQRRHQLARTPLRTPSSFVAGDEPAVPAGTAS